MIPLYSAGMVRTIVQTLAATFMAFVLFLYVSRNLDVTFLETYWREVSFASICVITAWLIAVTDALRPVVALFATIAFFVVAKIEEPSTANALAVLDGLAERILTGIQISKQG